MKHLDLFSGIGGFAYAADQVWDNVEHIFCDNDPFCQEVLKKHWPTSKIYGDIRTVEGEVADIVTGGFPCQPFSVAGHKRGTEDARHLWPEMLRVIRESKPTWVIAENVRGLLTQGGGVVFEQVCTDLEAEGYDVQPIIIPAISVNAPHQRDRVWFIANSTSLGRSSRSGFRQERQVLHNQDKLPPQDKPEGQGRKRWFAPIDETSWAETATELCRVDDGLPERLDKTRLKALGNAIVPQIAIEIMRSFNPHKKD